MAAPQHDSTTAGDFVRHTAWFAGVLLLTAVTLALMGRIVWCQCGGWIPWSWDIWTSHNSQHLIDPYFFSHVLHGVAFYYGLHLCWTTATVVQRFHVAIVIEAAWELLENSPLIINRYRTVTMSLDYFGDSIANSMSDILACSLGFALALKLEARYSIALFVLTEVVMTLAIRDCLLLNIVMLLCPIDAIRDWQAAGAPA